MVRVRPVFPDALEDHLPESSGVTGLRRRFMNITGIARS